MGERPGRPDGGAGRSGGPGGQGKETRGGKNEDREKGGLPRLSGAPKQAAKTGVGLQRRIRWRVLSLTIKAPEVFGLGGFKTWLSHLENHSGLEDAASQPGTYSQS